MKDIKKLLFRNKITKEVNAYDSWTVEWTSRHGEYHNDITQEFEVFTSLEDAKEYKQALEQAFEFLKFKSQSYVKLKANQ